MDKRVEKFYHEFLKENHNKSNLIYVTRPMNEKDFEDDPDSGPSKKCEVCDKKKPRFKLSVFYKKEYDKGRFVDVFFIFTCSSLCSDTWILQNV